MISIHRHKCTVACSAVPEDSAKSQLLAQMRDWLNEKVALADKVLVEHAVTKVYDGDVILTYAYSQVSRGGEGLLQVL